MQRNKKQKRGFIHIIIIIVLLLIILSLLGISLRNVFSNTLLQDNFGFVGDWLSYIWHSVLFTPVRAIFDVFLIPLWNRLVSTLQWGVNFNMPSLSVF